MSILDRCKAGSILEKPRPIEVGFDPAAADELKQRIIDSCLPAQREFMLDQKHRIIGYIGGFGSGKSYALARKIIWLGILNPNQVIMACEPTFPMIRTVLIPAMDEALDALNIDYEFRASPQPEYLLKLPTGSVTVLCQSAENFQRIRGQNLAAAVWDECDTSPTETAQKAGEMLLARMRTGNVNQLAVASTPEGFRWAYRTFVEQDGPDKRLIKVKTRDNPNLPKEFIPSLERNYPPQLIAAYLNGDFVNLAQCSVFPDFDRSRHYTDAEPKPSDTLFVGIDLNVGNCLVEVCVRRGDQFHFIGEHVFRDTQQIASGLIEAYRPWFDHDQLVLIPDAAAKQRSTAAAQESDIGILKKAGHRVAMQMSNPLIQDRINACNVLISQDRVLISNKCKNLRRSMEQWAFDDKGKPDKGGVGLDDLSHAADAATYAIYRLAAIKQWRSGGSNFRFS